MQEEEIIQGLTAGEEGAFRELVDRYRLRVLNTCLGIVQSREDAEDIAQEVFVEVYRSIRHFRADSKLSTWIYRIAVNKSLNVVRRRKRNKWLFPLEELLHGARTGDAAAGLSVPPYSTMEPSERLGSIHRAVDSLPEKQRIAFTLSKYEELSSREISEVMKLSVPGVDSLIHRAKMNLQKKLWTDYKNGNL